MTQNRSVGSPPSPALAILAAAHLVGFAILVGWVMPRPEQGARSVSGVPELLHYGSARTTDTAIRVAGVTPGCSVSAVGASFSCPKTFADGVPARVTYFQMPTLESQLGLVDDPLILLRIEQRGEVVYDKSVQAIRSQYFRIGLLVPICLFGASFLVCARRLRRVKSKGLTRAAQRGGHLDA